MSFGFFKTASNLATWDPAKEHTCSVTSKVPRTGFMLSLQVRLLGLPCTEPTMSPPGLRPLPVDGIYSTGLLSGTPFLGASLTWFLRHLLREVFPDTDTSPRSSASLLSPGAHALGLVCSREHMMACVGNSLCTGVNAGDVVGKA